MLSKLKFVDSNISDAATLPIKANTEMHNFVNYKEASVQLKLYPP